MSLNISCRYCRGRQQVQFELLIPRLVPGSRGRLGPRPQGGNSCREPALAPRPPRRSHLPPSTSRPAAQEAVGARPVPRPSAPSTPDWPLRPGVTDDFTVTAQSGYGFIKKKRKENTDVREEGAVILRKALICHGVSGHVDGGWEC